MKTQECHICLEDLHKDLVACPCGHIYHEDCIIHALQVNKQCPICRRQTSPHHLIRLFLEIPKPSLLSTSTHTTHNDNRELHERAELLKDRLHRTKEQVEKLLLSLKQVSHQNHTLEKEKEEMLKRVIDVVKENNGIKQKYHKCQLELERQMETSRQLQLNQSILQYLETCDDDALENDLQNPQQVIRALKTTCRYRHDQCQKLVREKTLLKQELERVQALKNTNTRSNSMLNMQGSRIRRKEDCINYKPKQFKKRKVEIQEQTTPLSTDVKSCFSASAYTDVPVRHTDNLVEAPNRRHMGYLKGFGGAPVLNIKQGTSKPICRQGYDETGKLTTYFFPTCPSTRGPVQSSVKPTKTIRHLSTSTLDKFAEKSRQSRTKARTMTNQGLQSWITTNNSE